MPSWKCWIAAGVAGVGTLTIDAGPWPGDAPRRASARDGSSRSAPPDGEPEALFARTIHPLLKARCFRCHGDGEELEGDLDLRSRKTMLQGGSRGPALVPGQPAQSLIYSAVQRTAALAMPPREADRLTAVDVAAVRAWIEAGAPWVESAPNR
jgi:hypothetical protein